MSHAANTANAQHSTGPRTPEGRARSSQMLALTVSRLAMLSSPPMNERNSTNF